eukprot:UN16733
MGHPLEICFLLFIKLIVKHKKYILDNIEYAFMIADISVHKLHNDKLDAAQFLTWKRVHSVQALQ